MNKIATPDKFFTVKKFVMCRNFVQTISLALLMKRRKKKGYFIMSAILHVVAPLKSGMNEFEL
jgi:hypothetical protein